MPKKIIFVSGLYLIGLGTAGIIAWLDHRSHATMSFSLLYFPVIMMVAWFGRRATAIVISLLCSAAWYLINRPSDGSSPVFLGSTAIHVFTFSFVAWMTIILRRGKHDGDLFQKKQGTALDTEMGLARHDDLTGALNSRGFQEKFSEERAKNLRYGRTTSLLHLDLDHFKEINDVHGHRFGDEMLKKVVSIINENIRDVDAVARNGGDEFIVMLPETESKRAEACAMRILAQMKKSLQRPLTGSVGIVSFGPASESDLEISKIADEAMYEAKKQGRDRVVMRDLTRKDFILTSSKI